MEKIKQQALNAVFHSTLIPLMYRETGRSTAKFIVYSNGLFCCFLKKLKIVQRIGETRLMKMDVD